MQLRLLEHATQEYVETRQLPSDEQLPPPDGSRIVVGDRATGKERPATVKWSTAPTLSQEGVLSCDVFVSLDEPESSSTEEAEIQGGH